MKLTGIESAAVEFEDPNSQVDVDRLLHMSMSPFTRSIYRMGGWREYI